ncbi:DUF6449 domain-containing protein [Clostridium tepidiprofundi]|nr:DUF6449 domain-containing protein [Clostridium tepidiprofundi]
MKYKTSFFSKGILLNDLKRFSWIGITYLLVLLFDIPLKILMSLVDKNNYGYISISNLFEFKSFIQICLLITLPVLTAIILFRYIQYKKSVDMIHCLPLKREKIYDSHIFAGMIVLIMPVVIVAIVSLLLKITLGIGDNYFTAKMVFSWGGITIIFNIIIFLFTVFIGMLTGSSTAQGILTYIFLFLPVGLAVSILQNVLYFVYGLSGDFMSEETLLNFSPLTKIFTLSYSTIHTKEVIIYITISVILMLSARVIYKKRKLEMASKAVAFEKLQPVFKYGVTLCFMLLGGFYFGVIQSGNVHWILFGYVLFSLIGYYIAEIIIKKSLKVFKNIKGYLIFASIAAIVLIGINHDITGFERRIPNLNNVESIYFDNSFHSKGEYSTFYEKDNLENIRNFHKSIIENRKNIKYNIKGRQERVAIEYRLKNGEILHRQYFVSKEMYNKYFKPIYESKEYKVMKNPLLKVSDNDVSEIAVNSLEGNKKLVINKPSEIKEAIYILKNELLNKKYEEISDKRSEWGYINISISGGKSKLLYGENLGIAWKKSYTEFEKWLYKKGYLENSRIVPKDVKYVIVEKNDGKSQSTNMTDNNIKKLKISDKSKIETCLRNYFFARGDNEYIVGFYLKNDEIIYGGFKKEFVPDFVKEYFKE